MVYKTPGFEIRTPKPQPVAWRRAIREALELSGGIVFIGYALSKSYNEKTFALVAALALLWTVYETNKISHE